MRILHSSKASKIEADTEIKRSLDSISEDFLRDVVETLSYPRHYKFEPLNNHRAAKWIFEQLQSYGYTTSYQGKFNNVVALPSEPPSTPAILIGAHYDSVPVTPGADDNASAIAALLACAKVMTEKNSHVPVCFVCFNREEDNRIGSMDFVTNYLPESGLRIAQAHVLEMVGYCSHEPGTQKKPHNLPVNIPDTGNFLGLIANNHSNALIKTLLQGAKSYLPDFPVVGLQVYFGLERYFLDLQRSDHAPFWKVGIPALMWTDTSEFRNPNYHRVTDTPATLDYEFLRQVTQLLLLQVLLFSSS
jgi:Zn-dependent M28 family amino/carboxypeptidase